LGHGGYVVRVRCSLFHEMLSFCHVNLIVMYHKVCKEFSCQKLTSLLFSGSKEKNAVKSAATKVYLFHPQSRVRKTFNTLE